MNANFNHEWLTMMVRVAVIQWMVTSPVMGAIQAAIQLLEVLGGCDCGKVIIGNWMVHGQSWWFCHPDNWVYNITGLMINGYCQWMVHGDHGHRWTGWFMVNWWSIEIDHDGQYVSKLSSWLSSLAINRGWLLVHDGQVGSLIANDGAQFCVLLKFLLLITVCVASILSFFRFTFLRFCPFYQNLIPLYLCFPLLHHQSIPPVSVGNRFILGLGRGLTLWKGSSVVSECCNHTPRHL